MSRSDCCKVMHPGVCTAMTIYSSVGTVVDIGNCADADCLKTDKLESKQCSKVTLNNGKMHRKELNPDYNCFFLLPLAKLALSMILVPNMFFFTHVSTHVSQTLCPAV